MTSDSCRCATLPSLTFSAECFNPVFWGHWTRSACPAGLAGWPQEHLSISRLEHQVPWVKSLSHHSFVFISFCQGLLVARKRKIKLDLLYVWLPFTGQDFLILFWPITSPGENTKQNKTSTKPPTCRCQIPGQLLVYWKRRNLAKGNWIAFRCLQRGKWGFLVRTWDVIDFQSKPNCNRATQIEFQRTPVLCYFK